MAQLFKDFHVLFCSEFGEFGEIPVSPVHQLFCQNSLLVMQTRCVNLTAPVAAHRNIGIREKLQNSIFLQPKKDSFGQKNGEGASVKASKLVSEGHLQCDVHRV